MSVERALAIERAVAAALERSSGIAQAAPRFLQAVCAPLGWACGACWLEPSPGAALECAGAWADGGAASAGFVAATRARGWAADGAGPAQACWAKGEAALVRGPASAAGLRDVFVFPITAEGRVLGVVELHGREIAEPDAHLLECARFIGDRLGAFCRRVQGDAGLREDARRFAGTIELAAIGIAHVDAGGRFTYVNRWLCDLLGYSRDELLGLTVKRISHPDDKNVTDDVRARMRSGEIPFFQMEKRYLRKNGTPIWVALRISIQRDAAGAPLHDIATFQDISTRKEAERALRWSEQRFRSLVEFSSDWYWELDADYRFTTLKGHGNNRGYAPGRELIGRRAWEIPGADQQTDWADLRTRLEGREPLHEFEYSYTDRRDQRFHVSVTGEAVFDETGAFVGYRGTSRDVSQRKQAEARIRYLATHDELTGLPNRAMFGELLGHVVRGARRSGQRFAVLFIDLDRFKVINDSLGHEAGDELLREIARRLKVGLRSSDVVARLGGDEFVIMLPDLRDTEQAGKVARKLLSAVIKPVELSGREWRVTASIGIAAFPDDAADEPSLMKHADLAMYKAKEEGKNNFQFYDSRLKERSLEGLTLETHLRHAIERGELSVHYQAKLDLATNAIAGVEALLRWNSVELGAVTPAKFIPIAEETGLILAIGKWVLRAACAQSVAWQRAGLPPLRMAVNLSPRQLGDPDLVADVREALADTGLRPELLELEVTESSVMRDLERATQVMTALKAMGVWLAIDDFGTGYSSLAQLKRFPIDTIKVDRSFIRDIPANAEDRAIAEAIVAVGKTLNLTVVAEGVETDGQEQFLRALACDQLQGYRFSRPLPADGFAALVREHAARPQ